MKRDVIEAAGLYHYAEIGLILFMVAFILIVLRLLTYKHHEIEHLENLPLDDADNNAARSTPHE